LASAVRWQVAYQPQEIAMGTASRISTVAVIGIVIAFGDVLAQSFSGTTPHHRGPRIPSHPQKPPPHPPGTEFGDPLPGLNAAQLADFDTGQDAFEEVDTPDSGLGPIFNNVSCVACHSVPETGGGSTILETRFGRTVNGHFDPLTSKGGSLLQQNAIDPAVQEVIPPEANVIAQRQTTPLFGLGLMEAISDFTIVSNSLGHKPDGVTGRVAIVQDVATGQTRVGRFGWKAQVATILSFAGDAYVNEVGITNRLFPQENAPNGNVALLMQYDKVPDPEDTTDPATGKADIDLFTDFMRFLAPPPQLAFTSAANSGEGLFAQIGCATCHQPSMTTAPNKIAALDRQEVRLYSDLLLHDMGSLGDGIAQGPAGTTEMRTAPLWGLRVRTTLLHDGRAPTIDKAIRFHDGEGAVARDRYVRMSPTLQSQLIEFLKSI
jgi:CxxC motif-containing protein (DUF1111 family)